MLARRITNLSSGDTPTCRRGFLVREVKRGSYVILTALDLLI
jgi:hypothetical protein